MLARTRSPRRRVLAARAEWLAAPLSGEEMLGTSATRSVKAEF
jgi:hypothetical protein